MKVLHVISSLAIADGHAAYCLQLAERLSARGMAQAILTLPTRGELTLPDPLGLVRHVRGCRFRALNITLPLFFRRQWDTLIDQVKPTIIHVHGGWHPFLYLCARLAQRNGIPIVLTLHGSLRPAFCEDDHRLKKRLAWRLYQRQLVEMADIVHVASEAEQEDLARLGFTKPVYVIPNGVDVDDDSGGKRITQEDGPPRNVLYLGRLHPLKGLDLLLEAWVQVMNEAPRSPSGSRIGAVDELRCWRLVLAGPDEQETLAALERQAKGLGLNFLHCAPDEAEYSLPTVPQKERSGVVLESTIIYLGPRYGEEKRRLLREANLFVLPSRSENFGLAVAEALTAGVPVITTKATPWAELLGHSGSSISTLELSNFRTSQCGWWVETDVESLAAALREAITLGDNERQAMGERGRMLVCAKYRWEVVVERMDEMYRVVSGEW